MGDFFGAWVAMGMCLGTLALTLGFYGHAQRQRQKIEKLESSFFTWEFVTRLFLPETILVGCSFVIGFGVGAVRTENWSLLVFLGVLATMVMVALGGIHYLIIVKAHGRASRDRRLSGTRSQLA